MWLCVIGAGKDVLALIRTAEQEGMELGILRAVEADAARALQRIPAGQGDRALGAGLQAGYRRPARGTQPGAAGRAAAGRCASAGA